MFKQIMGSREWDDKNVAEKGFTLIELLVVIVILGILAAVVVFSVGGLTDKGKKSACKIEGRTFATAQEAYNAATETNMGNGNYAAGASNAAQAVVLHTAGLLQSVQLGYIQANSANSYWSWTAATGLNTSACK